MNYLNLSPGAAPLVVKVSEGDIGREISFTLVEDGLEYSIPTGSTITCEILKSDGRGTSIPCTWSGSVVTLETTEQSTIRAGKATAELRIVNGADDIGTANFIIAVEPRPINADTDQTDSSYSQTGDAGDVWTLGSNGTPSWAPSGLDASSASAGQAPIADGAGGWAWGDVATSGDGVPTEVRQALLALFQNAAYISDDMADEVAVVQSWATEVTNITLNRTSLSFGSVQAVILQATTVPSGVSVIWATSDASVATVDGGVVTPVGNGQCTITASAGSKSATCAVSVSAFANLVSISAVYTQPGAVYDTDSLDSLKSDLVVTASYDNGTTQTVTDYTLSGTLTEGTSTITVSYGGKTTTFNVTVSPTKVLLYNWDLTNSLTDTVESKEATTVNTTLSSDGLHFENGKSGLLISEVYGYNRRYEIDIASTNADMSGNSGTKGSVYGFGNGVIAYFTSGNLSTAGQTPIFQFGWRGANDAFWTYINGAWQTAYSQITSPDYFSGKTLWFESDSDGHITIGVDDTILNEETETHTTIDNLMVGHTTGSQNGQCFRNMVISAIRIYEVVV